jgi:hypothetical protein
MSNENPRVVILGTLPLDDLRRAFAEGVAWSEWALHGATIIWQDDREKAEAEAERRYPGGRPRDDVEYVYPDQKRLCGPREATRPTVAEPFAGAGGMAEAIGRAMRRAMEEDFHG